MKLSKTSCRVLAAVLLIAALAGVSVGTVAWAASFTDVSSSAWYYDAVNFVTSKGLFNGTSSTQFTPNGVMTRAMFITVLGRYAKVDPDTWLAGQITGSGVNMRSGPTTGSGVVAVLSQGAAVTLAGRTGDWYKVRRGNQEGYVNAAYVSPRYHAFSDIDYGQYYAGYAVWAYEKNIVEGVGSANIFSPNGNVTRQQVCTLLNRFASFMGLKLSQTTAAVTFKDSASISSWAKDGVTAMQRAGVIEGMGNGNFEPNGSATRAQCATMLMRFDKACSGQATTRPSPTPTQRPSPTPQRPTPTPWTGTTTPEPGFPADTPATFISGTVHPRFTIVRVGIYVSTKSYDTCLSEAKFYNTNGTGFDYGVMGSDRRFIWSGTVDDRSISVTISGNTFTIWDSSGREVYSTGGALAIHPAGSGKGLTQVNGQDRYYGDFELRPAAYAAGKITVINFVDIEDYVRGVIPYEFGPHWPAETLKAAAVASRSHIMKTDLAYLSYGIDIVAKDGTQLYQGRKNGWSESSFADTDAAVDATAGQYLTYGGDICLCSFSACDGGQTLSAQQVFNVNYPYLISKLDPYETAIKGEIGNYDALVRASHRVGLSQWGAYAMGKYYHKDYLTILGFYYTGTHLQYGA